VKAEVKRVKEYWNIGILEYWKSGKGEWCRKR
jgi:hypothetical protein